jgi:hypothetical protein
MDELQALTTSIGEYTLDVLGRENLTGLQVTLDKRDRGAFMLIALADGSDEEQRRVIAEMFEVEKVFVDEAVLTYLFVDEIMSGATVDASTPQYSYV